MADDKENGWAKTLRDLEERSNRSKIVGATTKPEFSISFRDLTHPTKFDLVDRHSRSENKFCKINFIVSRGNQDFVFPIFIETESVEPTEYLKEAAHRLHLDLARLAEQTKMFKLRDEDPAEAEENPFG